MNVSSRANSLAVKWISELPRRTSRVAGSRWRSPTSSAAGRSGSPLRTSAPQPGEKLGEGERLDEIIVRSGVEARDPILDRVACSEDQHRGPVAVAPQLPARLESVDARQHHVEDDRVVLVRAGHPQRVLARTCDVRREALPREPAPDQACHPRLILDDEHPHRPILPGIRERQMNARRLSASWRSARSVRGRPGRPPP